MIKPCGICSTPYGEDLLESHHKVPRHLKGSDDPKNLIDICPICHTSVHTLARFLVQSQEKAAKFLNENFPGRTKVHDILIQLARVIIAEAEEMPEKDYVNVPWRAPVEIHAKLREMAKESRCSMISVLEAIVVKEWRARRGLKKPDFLRK